LRGVDPRNASSGFLNPLLPEQIQQRLKQQTAPAGQPLD
jgi:hypothetical protein